MFTPSTCNDGRPLDLSVQTICSFQAPSGLRNSSVTAAEWLS